MAVIFVPNFIDEAYYVSGKKPAYNSACNSEYKICQNVTFPPASISY